MSGEKWVIYGQAVNIQKLVFDAQETVASQDWSEEASVCYMPQFVVKTVPMKYTILQMLNPFASFSCVLYIVSLPGAVSFSNFLVTLSYILLKASFVSCQT